MDRFEGNTIAATMLLEEEVWYTSYFENYSDDEGPTIRDVVRLYPFAMRRPVAHSILAVSLEGDQPEIHEYREDDIFVTLREGGSPSESVYRAYSSYAELLGHIIAFKLDDDLVIEAAD